MKRTMRWAAWTVGALTLWIATIELAGLIAAERVPVTLPLLKSVVGVQDSYIVADGTWVLESDQQAFPLQTTEIRCERELKRCTGATATVMLGKMLSPDISFYEVIAWDSGRVIFKDDTPICVSYLYTIDVVSKSANAVRTRKTGSPDSPCGAYSQEVHMSLQEGWPIAYKLQQEATPWFGKVALAPFMLFR